MSDDKIIEALRQWGTNQPQGDGWSWDWCIDPRAEDAIYEIHRLRNEIEHLRNEIEHLQNRHRATVEHMAQEIAYLESEKLP